MEFGWKDSTIQHILSNPMDRRLCIQLCLNLELEKSNTSVGSADEQPVIIWETTTPVFCSEMQLFMSSDEISRKLDNSFDKIFKSIKAYIQL